MAGVLMATNLPPAAGNSTQQQAGVSLAVNTNDPAENELARLMADDDAALDEVDKWIQDNNAFTAQGAGESKEALNRRIRSRLDIVRKGYEDFIQRHPNSAHGHLACGSFLYSVGEEEAALAHYETAAQLEPKNPAAWNQIANYRGEHGPVTNAFADYARAIELNPAEPVYCRNLATTVYLFRRDAMAFYGLSEEQVFDKALALYRRALQLDPQNFLLATDYAQSYYGIRPLRTNDALAAWTNALQTARDDNEREGVWLHLARVKMIAGRFAEARAHLDGVTNTAFVAARRSLERSLAERETAATNPAGASTDVPAVPTNAIPVPAGASRRIP